MFFCLVLFWFGFSVEQIRVTIFQGVKRQKAMIFSDFFIYVPVFVDLWASMPLREGDSPDEVE